MDRHWKLLAHNEEVPQMDEVSHGAAMYQPFLVLGGNDGDMAKQCVRLVCNMHCVNWGEICVVVR